MKFIYRLFGLTVLANGPIPGLEPAGNNGDADVQVDLDGTAKEAGAGEDQQLWYEGPKSDEVIPLRVWALNGRKSFRFVYADGAEFLVKHGGARIWALRPETLTIEDMATYLVGPIMGFVLRLHGCLCLHASAVAMGGQVMAILGPASHGKSTTAAAFAKLGFPVLSDDIVALVEKDGAHMVQQGHPRIFLWPASVQGLFGTPDALPRVTPDNPLWEKRYLDLTKSPYRFQREPLRLGAVYIGEQAEDGTTESVEPLTFLDAMPHLIRNTHSSHLLDKDMRAQEFGSLTQLVRNVHLRRFKARDGMNHLPVLCDVLSNDFHAIVQENKA